MKLLYKKSVWEKVLIFNMENMQMDKEDICQEHLVACNLSFYPTNCPNLFGTTLL